MTHTYVRAAGQRLLIGLMAGVLIGSQALLAAADEKSNGPQTASLDVLVIAPHSDDEAIGCTAVVLRALAQKKRVGIVIVTAGDGFPKAAAAAAKKDQNQLVPADFFNLAALRQRHSLQAMEKIGVSSDELVFLGYPDSGLEKVYNSAGDAPFRQAYTKQNETYGSAVRDYHSLVYKRPAPYLKASLVGDLAEIITKRKPNEIYTTHEVDKHSDHRATFWFVRDATRAANYRGPLYTYVVHGLPPRDPPTKRVVLTDDELKTKRATLEIFQTGVSPVHDDLAERYTKPEELFWLARPAADKPE